MENHLNYIRGVWKDLDDELACGLSALLNSVCLDRYFRISNGNTQVSATELRAMPLPAEEEIRSIGVRSTAATQHPRRRLPASTTLWPTILNLPRDVGMELEPATWDEQDR